MHTSKNTDNEHARSLRSTDWLAVAEWLVGSDTGISSTYMAAVAIGGGVLKRDATPSDAPDLGRCVRLIEKAPSVRNAFPILRMASPVWETYVDHWDELTKLWHEDNYDVTTRRMNELRASANGPIKRAANN